MLQMLFMRAAPTLMLPSFPFAVAFQGFSCGNWSACGECRQGWRQVYTLAVVFQICSAPHKHCTEFWVPWVLFSIGAFFVSGNAGIATQQLNLQLPHDDPAVAAGTQTTTSCFVWVCGRSCQIAILLHPLLCLLHHHHHHLLHLLLCSIVMELWRFHWYHMR